MAPTLVREPFHRDGWVYEEKVDGWRIMAYKHGGRVHLVSRHGRDHTRRFRDIAVAISKLPARSLVLDGEVAIFDQQTAIPLRLAAPRPCRGGGGHAAHVHRLDALDRNGEDLTSLPQSARRIHLEDVVADGSLVLPARRLAWAQVRGSGWEGYVAKDEASEYRGGPTRSWLKVKVPGWTDAEDGWRRARLDS
jgi:bifunctional non-homologous end joining protein LigD